jgi:hypothetical protein
MAEAQQGESKLTVSQEFSVLQPRPQNAYPIGEADWRRIRRMIKEIVPPNNVYQQISFTSLGVLGSSIFALISLELSSKSPPNWVWTVVWCMFAASLVATVALYFAGSDLKKATVRTAGSVLVEMTEIEQSCAPTAAIESSSGKVTAENAGLMLVSADYGADGHPWIDVKPALKGMIKGGKLCIQVTNEELGSDPVRNVPKKLRLVYRFNGKDYRLEVAEGDKLSIPVS